MEDLCYLHRKSKCANLVSNYISNIHTFYIVQAQLLYFLCLLIIRLILGKSHGKLGKHHYFLSWREPWNKFEDWDWFNARNFCRERCMDLVSFETAHEFQMFKEVMIAGKLNYGLCLQHKYEKVHMHKK